MRPSGDVIRVGSKNFTEQILLGELLAQTIEAQTRLAVERRLNLGGTFICDRALRSGDIDVYVEYTGTALTAIFHEPVETDPAQVLETVRQPLRRRRPDAARSARLREHVRDPGARRRCAGAAPARRSATPRRMRRSWQAASATSSCSAPTAIPGLAKAYGLHFGAPPRAMDLSLIYRALADRQVDLIAGDATSGLIEAYGLTMLKDNATIFRPTTPCRWRGARCCSRIRRSAQALATLRRPHLGRRHAAHEPRRRRRASGSGAWSASSCAASWSCATARCAAPRWPSACSHDWPALERNGSTGEYQRMASQNSFNTRTPLIRRRRHRSHLQPAGAREGRLPERSRGCRTR